MRIKTKWFILMYEPNWRDRPHPYWFNRKQPFGGRQIDIPFFHFITRSR